MDQILAASLEAERAALLSKWGGSLLDPVEAALALRPTRCPGSNMPMVSSAPAALCHCGQTFQKPDDAAGARAWLLPEHEGATP